MILLVLKKCHLNYTICSTEHLVIVATQLTEINSWQKKTHGFLILCYINRGQTKHLLVILILHWYAGTYRTLTWSRLQTQFVEWFKQSTYHPVRDPYWSICVALSVHIPTCQQKIYVISSGPTWMLPAYKICNTAGYSMVWTVFTAPIAYQHVNQGKPGMPIWYKVYTTWYSQNRVCAIWYRSSVYVQYQAVSSLLFFILFMVFSETR